MITDTMDSQDKTVFFFNGINKMTSANNKGQMTRHHNKFILGSLVGIVLIIIDCEL